MTRRQAATAARQADATPQRRGTAPSAQTPTADVFARTVPLIVEKHYFGETKKASMAHVRIEGAQQEEPQQGQEQIKRLLSLRKRLINSEELRAIRQCDTRFREYLHTVATPFRPGFYLVPIGLAEQVHQRAEAWEREREELADRAERSYPGHVRAMEQQLGPMFNALDYPSAARFRAAYWVDWRFVDFGVPNVLRELRRDLLQREEVKMQRLGAQARALVENHLRSSLLEITQHLTGLLAERPDGKRVALRQGALDRLVGFLGAFEARNVTNDADLRRVVEQVRRLGSGLSVELLRDDDALRARTAEALGGVTTALAALVEEVPERGIRFEEEEEVGA